jgi:hypothetical protein
MPFVDEAFSQSTAAKSFLACGALKFLPLSPAAGLGAPFFWHSFSMHIFGLRLNKQQQQQSQRRTRVRGRTHLALGRASVMSASSQAARSGVGRLWSAPPVRFS